MHEGGISSPLVAHWPSGIDAKRQGKLENQPGHLIDLMATCVDLGQATYPKKIGATAIVPMQGTSLAPAFNGKKIGRKKPIYWEHEGNRAVRKGDYKLVAMHDTPWELYDMNKDRSELKDLSKSMPGKANELRLLYEAWAKRVGALPWNEVHVKKKKKN